MTKLPKEISKANTLRKIEMISKAVMGTFRKIILSLICNFIQYNMLFINI